MFKQLITALSAAVIAAVITAIASHFILADMNRLTISNLESDIAELKGRINDLTGEQRLIENSLHANRIFFASRHPDADLAILFPLSKFWKMRTDEYEKIADAIFNNTISIDSTGEKPEIKTGDPQLTTIIKAYQLDAYDIDSLRLLGEIHRFEYSKAEPGQRVEWFDRIAKSVEDNNQFRQQLIDYSKGYESLLRRTTQTPAIEE